MEKLSLYEIAESQLSDTPIVPGQLICCLDTGNFYRDKGTSRIQIGSDLIVVSSLPLAPLSNKLYLLKPDKLYFYDEKWYCVNEKPSNIDILEKIEVPLTNSLKNNYDIAYTHSQSSHAPANAERNVIVGVQENGSDISVDSTTRKVNIIVPTKTSQLTNDSGYKTTDNNTTYDFGASVSSTNGNVNLALTGSDSSTDSITVKGSGSVVVTSDANGNITVSGTDTKYSHPNSGITAGTYKSVTVNAQGHVTGGSNPTTLSGYGITDAATTASLNTEIARATAAENNLTSAKANVESPTLTGTPKAPTASAGTNTTQIATTAFVQTAVSNGIAASDAMIIKGTLGTTGTVTALPTTYKTGWTYRVVTAGTYAGQVCEIGDLIIALIDRSGTSNANSDWCVAQTNINGAITGVKSGDAYITASQSGSVITITHTDVARTNSTSTSSPTHGGTFTAVKSVTSDAKGHVTGVDTETIALPAYSAGSGLAISGTTINHSNSVTAGTAQGDANKTLTFGGTFLVPSVTYDAQGHITAKGTTIMTMPATPTTVSGNSGSATKLATARAIDGVTFNGTAAITHYSTCSTAAATAGKTVALTGFTLTTGSRVMVKFTVTNTASSPTLNVNSTGAAPIMYRGSAISAGYLAANRVYEFVYDGTNWELVGDINTDTNTWRGIQNNLTSTSTKDSLAAAQGTVLKDLIDEKLPIINPVASGGFVLNSLNSSNISSTVSGLVIAYATSGQDSVGYGKISDVSKGSIAGGYLSSPRSCSDENGCSIVSKYGSIAFGSVYDRYSDSATSGGSSNITALCGSFAGGNARFEGAYSAKITSGGLDSDNNATGAGSIAYGHVLAKNNNSSINVSGYGCFGFGCINQENSNKYDIALDIDGYGNFGGGYLLKNSKITGFGNFTWGYDITIGTSQTNFNSIISTSSTIKDDCVGSSIIGGASHIISKKGNSGIFCGQTHTIVSYSSVIIGGCINKIIGDEENTTLDCNGIIGGYANQILDKAKYSIILGGTSNKIGDSSSGILFSNTILNGTKNEIIKGSYSVVYGNSNSNIDSMCMLCGGYGNKSTYSYLTNIGTTTNYAGRTILGRYNKSSIHTDMFVIGAGMDEDSRVNVFRVTNSGEVYGLSSFNSSGADYAELIYEWDDLNPNNEDRVGYFVTVQNQKIKKATSSDYIIGIISGNPSIIGNADEDYFWRWKRDEFNRIKFKEIPITYEKEDGNGNVVMVKSETETVLIEEERDDYDSSQEYISRKDRPEWDYVGMMGCIPVRDDGSCIPGEYCKCNDEGIATIASSEDVQVNKFTYMVLERISEKVVKVVMK